MRRGAIIVPVLVACGPRAWGEPEPIVTAEGWRPFEGDDPFGEPPAGAWCDSLGWGPESFGGEPSLDVKTGACDWLTVRQPTSAEVLRTDRLFFRLWHDLLVAPGDGALSRVGLAMGDRILFVEEIPIPAQSGIVLADLDLGQLVPAGTELLFHVDNHGANSYHLLEISRRPAVPPKDAVDLGVPP